MITGLATAADLPITAVASAGFRVSDMEKAHSFYSGAMGYQEAFQVKDASGAPIHYFKVNDEQFIEIQPGLKPAEVVRLMHYSILTTNVKSAQKALAQRGLSPSALSKGPDGTLQCSLNDPDGQEIRFVEYVPGSMQAQSKGKFMDERRISRRILHAGVAVEDLERAMAFYRDKLGLMEMWRGAREPGRVDWVAMKIPASPGDYIEFMVHKDPMTRALYGSFNHLGLEVPEINTAYKTANQRRGLPPDYDRGSPKLGLSSSWVAQAVDPDGTRMEWEQRPKCTDVEGKAYALHPCLK